MTNSSGGDHTWECFLCHGIHTNTLCYCPKCNIARKHSFNLRESHLKKKEEKLKQIKRRHEEIMANMNKIQKRHKR